MRMLVILAMFLALTANGYAGMCGIVPIKPIVPIGCKDLVPECVCDSTGNDCHYVWVCVK